MVVSELALAQTADRRAMQAAYVEVLGSGFLFSVNYERRLEEAVIIRLGGLYGGEKAYWGFVQGVWQESLAASHHLEFGGGIGIIGFELNLWGSSQPGPAEPHVYFPFHAGYRFQPSSGGFVFRAGFTPLVAVKKTTGEVGVLPWGGLAVGWSW